MNELERGRESYARRAWMDAYASLVAGRSGGAAGQRRTSSCWPRPPTCSAATTPYVSGLERAHHALPGAAASALRAARCAFWLGINLAMRGEMGRATGWLGRAQRLVEREERDCVERGYLLLPLMFEHVAAGDYEAADATARRGRRDRRALRRCRPVRPRRCRSRASLLIRQGRVAEGLRLLDEAMVAVTAGSCRRSSPASSIAA